MPGQAVGEKLTKTPEMVDLAAHNLCVGHKTLTHERCVVSCMLRGPTSSSVCLEGGLRSQILSLRLASLHRETVSKKQTKKDLNHKHVICPVGMGLVFPIFFPISHFCHGNFFSMNVPLLCLESMQLLLLFFFILPRPPK